MAGSIGFPQFHDFDDESIYKSFEKDLMRVEARNFCIQFDRNNASAAMDLDENAMRNLMQIEVRLYVLPWASTAHIRSMFLLEWSKGSLLVYRKMLIVSQISAVEEHEY